MDKQNRPRGREKHVTGGGTGVHRRGSGLGTGGPVGNPGGYGNRPKEGAGNPGGSGNEGNKGILGSLLGGMGGGMYGGPQNGMGGMFMGTPAGRRNSGCGCGS